MSKSADRKSSSKVSRRRFAFWVSFGLFALGERFQVQAFDDLAANAMGDTKTAKGLPEHWTVAENELWRWYERENLVDGVWKLTGITTPISKESGEPYAGQEGYLDEKLVPIAVRLGTDNNDPKSVARTGLEDAPGRPSEARRERHGRPPSRWLRSLKADELRIWLKTIDVPEAGVSGMTFWVHLTRDHSFDPEKIEGLDIDEQAKLHAAAHYGY